MEDTEDEEKRAGRAARLAAHAAVCDECRSGPLPLEHLVTLLNVDAVEIDSSGLSRRALARVRPALQRRALAASGRRVLLSLLPLPAVLAYDAYFLNVVYHAVAVLLPAALAAYLVLSYGAVLVLLFALTYAAIPVLVMRGEAPRLSALG
jgi:hypothetical protein